MARLSGEELKAARKRRAEERAAEEQRAQEARAHALKELEQRYEQLEQRQLELASQREEIAQRLAQQAKVASTTHALYIEIDKLAKKSPRDEVSQLTVDMTNRAITALKALFDGTLDEFAEQIVPIVPAGDLPETRDVLLLLGQMRAALERLRGNLETKQAQTESERKTLAEEQRNLRQQLQEEDEEEDDDAYGIETLHLQ